MRIVIIGGAGFLGQKLAKALAARGEMKGRAITGIMLADAVAPAPVEAPFPVDTTVVDITDPVGLAAAVVGADVIYHLAAVVSAQAEAEFDLGIDINLMGTFYGMKYQLPAMVKGFEKEGRRGAILNIASLAGIGGAPTIGMYAAAKHGVVGLSKSAALEYVRRGIRVNCLCPSFARTPIVTDGLLAGQEGNKEAEDYLTRGIPMRRLAEPEEITKSMLWICDPENSFMTGQAIALDGGTSAMGR